METWLRKRGQESVFINLLLSSISVFYLLCRLAEIWHDPLVAALAIFMAGVMVTLAFAVLLLHDADEVSPTTLGLVYICCLVQLCGLFWRICLEKLDPLSVAYHMCTIVTMGIVLMYSRYVDRKKYLLI